MTDDNVLQPTKDMGEEESFKVAKSLSAQAELYLAHFQCALLDWKPKGVEVMQ